MTTTFRPITLDDVEVIVDVLCRVADNPGMAADFRHDALEQARGEIPNSITYVICADDHRIGRLRVVRTDDCIEIAGLQVHPDWQNRGHGTAVIKTMFDEAERAARPVELDVDRRNTAAQRLYERLGFRRVRTVEDDYRMRRSVLAQHS